MDLRFAADDSGELYVLTKADGMIRKVVGAEVTTAAAVPAVGASADRAGGRSGRTSPACRPRP